MQMLKKGQSFNPTQVTCVQFTDGPGSVFKGDELVAHGEKLKLKGLKGPLTLSKQGFVKIPPSSAVKSDEPTLTNLDKMPGQLSPAEAAVMIGLREAKRERLKMQKIAAEITKKQQQAVIEEDPEDPEEVEETQEPAASEERTEDE